MQGVLAFELDQRRKKYQTAATPATQTAKINRPVRTSIQPFDVSGVRVGLEAARGPRRLRSKTRRWLFLSIHNDFDAVYEQVGCTIPVFVCKDIQAFECIGDVVGVRVS